MRQNVIRFEADFSSRTVEVVPLTSRLNKLDSRPTVTSTELSAVTRECDRYHRLLSAQTHRSDSLETIFSRVVTETRSGRASIQRSVALLLSEFQQDPPSEHESP